MQRMDRHDGVLYTTVSVVLARLVRDRYSQCSSYERNTHNRSSWIWTNVTAVQGRKRDELEKEISLVMIVVTCTPWAQES